MKNIQKKKKDSNQLKETEAAKVEKDEIETYEDLNAESFKIGVRKLYSFYISSENEYDIDFDKSA